MTDKEIELVLEKLEDVKKDINTVDKNVCLLSQSVDSIVDRIEDNKAEIKQLKSMVYGNGTKGLSARISLIEEWIATRSFYEKAIILAVIGETVALIFALIKLA